MSASSYIPLFVALFVTLSICLMLLDIGFQLIDRLDTNSVFKAFLSGAVGALSMIAGVLASSGALWFLGFSI